MEILERLLEGYEIEYSNNGRRFWISQNEIVRDFFGMEKLEKKFG